MAFQFLDKLNQIYLILSISKLKILIVLLYILGRRSWGHVELEEDEKKWHFFILYRVQNWLQRDFQMDMLWWGVIFLSPFLHRGLFPSSLIFGFLKLRKWYTFPWNQRFTIEYPKGSWWQLGVNRKAIWHINYLTFLETWDWLWCIIF